ncbi:MAG: DUF4070 domain-containing protein [Chthoniobacteraceae bacterium]
MQRIYRSEPAGLYDLREAPVPRFDLLDPEKYNRITVQTSRGCPHKCEFCASSILLTPRYKLKPVAKVIGEIHAIKRIWSWPFIEFADDNSFVNRAHYKELLRAMIPEKLRWFTETDIRVAGDDELLGLMRQFERYMTAIERIQSRGITVNGCFILGLDGDTPEVFDEVFRFVRQSGLYEVQITMLTAFPGTPLYRRLKAEGRILRDRAWDLCTLFDLNVRPKDMSVAELQSGFVDLARRLYSEEETSARRDAFGERRRESRRGNLAVAA